MWDSPRRFSPSQLSSFVLCLLFQLQFYLYTLATHAVAAYPPQSYQLTKNLLFHFRKVCCVVYFIENFVENSLGFCNLFSQCVCTLHTSFHGSYRKTLWSNFLVTDFFLILYFFFQIGNPQKLL